MLPKLAKFTYNQIGKITINVSYIISSDFVHSSKSCVFSLSLHNCAMVPWMLIIKQFQGRLACIYYLFARANSRKHCRCMGRPE